MLLLFGFWKLNNVRKENDISKYNKVYITDSENQVVYEKLQQCSSSF